MRTEENCGRNTINDLFKRTRTNRRKASNAVYMIMFNANKDYPENKQRFLLNKKKEPLVRPTPPSQSSEYVRVWNICKETN